MFEIGHIDSDGFSDLRRYFQTDPKGQAEAAKFAADMDAALKAADTATTANAVIELAATRDELAAIKWERDTLIIQTAHLSRQLTALMMGGQRLTVSAEAAKDALLARADADGALHADAIVEVLKSMGAR